jgi:PAS domain S-box-containing protein
VIEQSGIMRHKFFTKLLVIGILVFGFGSLAAATLDQTEKTSTSVLTEAQRQWLAAHPDLRIGLTSIPPQVFYDPATGKLTGLCMDYLHALEKHIGYSFRKGYFQTWDEMMQAAFEGRIDVVYAAQQTPLRNEKFLFTQPYLEFQNMIVTCQDVRGSVNLESLSGKKVAVVHGNSIEEDLSRQYPTIHLLPVENELRGLSLVSFREADAMVIEPARASYLIEERKITNLRIAGSTGMYFRLGFAVRKDMPELCEILDAGLAAIPAAKKTAMQNQWIQLSFKAYLAWLWWMLAGCGTLVFGVIVWNLLLRRQVERRTVELREELRRRTLAEESRQQTEEQFRHVIEFCPLGVLMYRLENNDRLVLTAGNTAAEKILGIDLRPQLGKTLEEVFPYLEHTDIPERYRRICKNGIPWEAHGFRYKDEHTQGIYEIYAFQTSAGQMTVMFTDISERIRSREAMERSEAQLSSIFRAAPVGIGLIIDRTFITVNDCLCNMLGYTREELVGQNSRMIYPTQEDYDRVGSEKYAQIRKTGLGTIQTRWQRKDGQVRDILLSSSAIDIQDLSKGLTFTALDITDQIQAQQALAESQRILLTLMGNLPGIAYRCRNTPDWPMEFISKGCKDLTGYDDSEFYKNAALWQSIIHPDDRQTMWNQVQDALAGRKNYQLEYRIRTADGQEKWAWEQGCGIFDNSGNVAALEGFITDITARKQIKLELQQFRFAVEHSGESAYRVSPDGKFLYVNDAACRQLGYSRQELLTMGIADIDIQFPMEHWVEYWNELKEKKFWRFETCHKSKEGRRFPVEISSNFVQFGGSEYIYAFGRDIRERKQYEQTTEAFMQIISSTTGQDMFRAFARQIAEQLGADIVVVGQLSDSEPHQIQTLAVFKDGQFESDFSYSPEGAPCGQVISKNSGFCVFKDNVAEQFPQDELLSQEHLRSYIGTPLLDARQKPIGLICVLYRKPITDTVFAEFAETVLKIFANQAAMELQRMAAQQELSYSEYRFREMFQRMSSAVSVYRAVDDGADFIFADFNPAAERIEKIKKENLIGHKVTEVFPGVREFGILDVFRQVWLTGQPMHYPLKQYKDDRVVGWRDNYVYRLPTMEVVALYDDVTERILAEDAREKLMKELQAKNEELESIVFIASHDLRSPLINIQGFAGELQKSCRELTVFLGREALSEINSRAVRRILDEDIPESLNFISAGTGKMDALVKGLLRLARIGITQMHIEPVDMNRLMATILKTVQYQMREYDIEIRADNLPPCLGDWVQLNQVFSNLIDNSIKYRHPGRKSVIEITAIVRDNKVRYAVRDNGIGVAPEHNKKIFEIFHRLNPAGPVKGEGLGLTIVQRILDRLDGKIDVESSPDNGATFIVELPAAQEK